MSAPTARPPRAAEAPNAQRDGTRFGAPRQVTTRVRRWAELVEFALDNPGHEATDALLILAEELEAALAAAEGEAAR